MPSSTRVTVIMPMRDAVRYVARAIRSVLSQEHRALELVVVDDGSTDGSRAVVEACADRRVRVVGGPERGIAAAYNAGLAVATGDVLMRCDADDALADGAIAALLGALERRPDHGAVCGRFRAVEPCGRIVVDFDTGAVAEDITAELLSGSTRTHLNTFAVRAEHIRALGGCREYFETGEDIDLQLRLASVCRVWYEPVQVYEYRLHDGSVTHRQSTERRVFFESLARASSRERASGEADALDRGAPPAPPRSGRRPLRSGRHIHDLLLGEAWRLHARGERLGAIAAGLRALGSHPLDPRSWWSVSRLVSKVR